MHFFSKVIFFAMALLVLANCTVNVETSTNSTNSLFKQFAFGLPSLTVNYLRQHNCTVRKTRKKQVRSVERWTDAFVDCRDLIDNNIPVVVCERKCIHPVSCKLMSDFIGRPVTIRRNVTNRGGIQTGVEFPVACMCVPKRRDEAMNCQIFPPRLG